MDKKEKTSCFTVLPLIDISNFPDAETADFFPELFISTLWLL